MNNDLPFPSNTWWKKGNEHIRDLIDNTGNGNNNIHNSMKRNLKETVSNNLNTETNASSSFPSILANYNTDSSMIGNSIATQASVAPILPLASSGDQRSSSLLQLLGEVASSGGNHHRGMHHPQHQLLQQHELQAMRMQENSAAITSSVNNAQDFNRNPFLGFTSQVPYSTSLNNNSISRMAIQSRLQPGNILDPSIFPPEGINMTPLQLQQQQHHQQQQQQNFQSMYPLGYTQSSTPIFSTQNSFLQQRQTNAQRQQVQRPEVARAEMKIDAIRTAGDIGDASRLPAVERELEESYQQDAYFEEEGASGGNGNEQQKTNVNNNVSNKRKDSIGSMDVNDLVFSDIVPMMPRSGPQPLKVQGFDSDVDVDDIDVDAIVGGNSNIDKLVSHQPNHIASSTINQSQSTQFQTPSSRMKEVKFRAYQAENWTEKFEELLRFREENGHCLVPNCHPENPALAQWTKRQRYQYKLKQDAKRSTITDERVIALDEVGFVWDSHKAVWSERLEELKGFKKEYKHCNVPSRYKPNHQLAIWVKRQRRQWKNKLDRLPNCMTDERQRALESIGFVWDMKKGKKSPVGSPNKQRVIKK